MSLPGTHICFAIDLKDKYKIKDVRKYLAGAIYPDSRYSSGIDRNLTHNQKILSKKFATTDFKKGWQTHQIFDNFYTIEENKILQKLNYKNIDNEEIYLIGTTIKIILDINICKDFAIQKYIKYINYAYNPNGEKISDIKKYNKFFEHFYQNKKNFLIQNYYEMAFYFGASKQQADRIKKYFKEINTNKKMVTKIKNIYNDALLLLT